MPSDRLDAASGDGLGDDLDRPRTHQMLANLRGSASSLTAPATPPAYYAQLEAVPMAA
jgi:hypothetical protein